MRLGRDGSSRPWRELLETACNARRVEISHGHRTGSDEAPHLGQRHLYFVLNLVAKQLDQRSLTPADYERGREELVEAERRRRSARHPHQPQLLADLLPNAAQIERIARAETKKDRTTREKEAPSADNDPDNAVTEVLAEPAPEPEPEAGSNGQGVARGDAAWDRALELAGLEPRTEIRKERHEKRRQERVLPLAEAIHHFVEANGRWPSQHALQKFAEMANVAMEDKSVTNKPWADYLTDVNRLRDGLGLKSPTKSPAEVRSDPKSVKAPASGIPGAPPRRRSGSGAITKEDCLAALAQFDRELAPGKRRTRAAYARFAVDHGLPSPTVFDRRFNGFTALMAEMRRGTAA